MKITRADKEDHLELTNISKLSKAYWGYSEAELKLWDDELTVTTDYIESCAVFKLVEEVRIVAYYSIEVVDRITMELDRLFVHPDYTRQGFGHRLLCHAIHFSKSVDKEVITVESDPNAVPFYEQNGFSKVGKRESQIPGRFLPVMRKYIGYDNKGGLMERLSL